MNAKAESLHEEGHSEIRSKASPPSEGASRRWNDLRYAEGKSAGHVESYFLKLNDPEGRRALWLKATVLRRDGGTVIADAWAVAFDRESGHVAAKDSTPFADARFGAQGLDAHVCNLHLSPGRIVGSVGEGEKRISFDLSFTMPSPPLVPFPTERMYETPLPSSKLVSPHPDSIFTGTYTRPGRGGVETVAVDRWRGMQGHNWGTRHAELYAWCHVNQWDGEPDLLLEGFTARVKMGPVLAPPLTVLCVWHRGIRYELNGPIALVRARGHIDDLRKWRFHAKNKLAEISGELYASTEDFVGLTYENPDGAITYCLNSKIARGRMRLSVKGRPDLDVITKAAALEIGTKDAHHGVKMLA